MLCFLIRVGGAADDRRVFPGQFFEANPPNKDTDYFTVWLDYKF